jgi:hypothetical protein
LLNDTAISLSDIYSKELKAETQTDIFTPMLITVIVTKSKMHK